MNRDEKNSQLRSIIEKLCKEQIFSNVDDIIAKFIKKDLSIIIQNLQL